MLQGCINVLNGLDRDGGIPNNKWCTNSSFSSITNFALFVIGCIGAAVGGAAIAALILALAAGSLALNLTSNEHQEERKYLFIIPNLVAMVLILVGALGCAGILPPNQVGWGSITTIMVSWRLTEFLNRLYANNDF